MPWRILARPSWREPSSASCLADFYRYDGKSALPLVVLQSFASRTFFLELVVFAQIGQASCKVAGPLLVNWRTDW